MVTKIELENKKNISLEFIDDQNRYKTILFNETNLHELKSKLKEYKKFGTITFTNIKDNSIENYSFKPTFVRVVKVLEMYKNDKDNE
jgi:hypothetical protein